MTMLCPRLCVRLYCTPVHTDCDCTVVLLTDQSIQFIQGTQHTHDTHTHTYTWHRQSQMLSSGSPTKKNLKEKCQLAADNFFAWWDGIFIIGYTVRSVDSLGGPASGGTVPEAFLGVSCVFWYIMVQENLTDGRVAKILFSSGILIFAKKCPKYVFSKFTRNMTHDIKQMFVFFSILFILSWSVS